MPSEKEVYANHPSQYDRLIQREDYQHNILSAIEEIMPVKNIDAIDIGTGTGRLSRILAPLVHIITALDLSLPMTKIAKSVLQGTGTKNWNLAVGDNAFLPLKDKSADLVISGWSFCYLAVWGGDQWQSHLQKGLDGIKRILRKDGTIIILETMGTGFESPNPPPHLNNYFRFLERSGFSSTWIRTDYQFASQVEAEELSAFFFGEELTEKVKKNCWVVLPECTGIWWLKI